VAVGREEAEEAVLEAVGEELDGDLLLGVGRVDALEGHRIPLSP